MLKIEDAVSETLLITLYMRHLASNRPDPIIRDESASRLVAEIDYDFSKFDHAERSIIGTAIRADYFDKLAADFIRRQPNPVIVVIGCGLDDRRGRIGRAADNVPFYQLDLPEVIAIRRKLLPPQAGETLIEASAFDTGWMEDVSGSHPDAQFFLILEGVLTYFDNETVGGLFKNLARYFHHSESVFDVSSSWMVKNSGKHDAVKHTRARFAFGCDDDREIECWADNLHLISAKYMATDFPAWKRQGLFYWIMRLVPVLRNSYRLLHYRID